MHFNQLIMIGNVSRKITAIIYHSFSTILKLKNLKIKFVDLGSNNRIILCIKVLNNIC